MVHEDETEVCVFRSVGRQILLQPVHCAINGLDGGCIGGLTGCLGVHLEQAPRVAVHGDDMQTGIVQRTVALDLCTVFLILNGINIGIEVNAALIVVAGGINDRIGMDIIVIHLALEPEAELLCLCAGTFYKVAAVQQQVGVKFLDGLIQFLAGCKDMRIGQRDQANLIRLVAQRLKAGFAGFAALQLNLVVITGSGSQIVQLVVEQIHLLALEIRCIGVDVHFDRVAEFVFICAVCDGGRNLFCALPYDYHTGGFRCQQIRTVLEFCAAVCRKRGRYHSRYHHNRQHDRTQPLQYFSHHFSFSPLFFCYEISALFVFLLCLIGLSQTGAYPVCIAIHCAPLMISVNCCTRRVRFAPAHCIS